MDRIIGRSLTAMGATASSLAFLQLLFQQDNTAMPFEISLPAAICAVVGGAAAVQIGLRMSAA